MDTSDSMEKINPQISEIEVGIRKMRKIKIYPLSVCDQLQASKVVTEIISHFVAMKETTGINDTVVFALFLEKFRDNASDILKLVIDDHEDSEALLKDISNVQMIELVKIIYQVNFEPLLKNVKSLSEKLKEKKEGKE